MKKHHKQLWLSIISNGYYIDEKLFDNETWELSWKQLLDYLEIQQPNENCKVIIESNTATY